MTRPLPGEFFTAGSSSFSDFLTSQAALPTRLGSAAAEATVPHGTTVVAVAFGHVEGAPTGVAMAGDRRATLGNLIAGRDIRKVFRTDDRSVVGIAGTAGIATELVTLFSVELEHYEKIEGMPLSLSGKANRLASMLRGNLGLALQGLAVVPMFAGVGEDGVARIFGYDVAGGCYEEQDHHGIGSGAIFARGALKKLWRPGLSREEAVRVAVEALFDAADDDAATGGPDVARRIWPTVAVVEAAGAEVLPDDGVGTVVESVVSGRWGGHR